MGFGKVAKTSAKRKEIQYLFHHKIAVMVESHCIPHSWILNIDQILLKHISVGIFTLVNKGVKSVTMERDNSKRCITATFGIILNNNFQLIQLICAQKTEQSFPCHKSSDEFSLSVIQTHYSNSTESIELIDEIIAPELENKWQKFSLPPVFKGLHNMGSLLFK